MALGEAVGAEALDLAEAALGEVLGKTLGVPLFQEQAMQIAIVGADFTPDEADRLRRALGTFKGDGTVYRFRERFLAGMAANGCSPRSAPSRRCSRASTSRRCPPPSRSRSRPACAT